MKKLKAIRNVKISIDGKQEKISKDQVLEHELSSSEIERLLSSCAFEVVKEQKTEPKKTIKK